jgi:hypothetical protein
MVHPVTSLRLSVQKLKVRSKIKRAAALYRPCFQHFDLNPVTVTFAGKSFFELVVVLPRCPLSLGSGSSEAQFGFFQFGHAITFMGFAAGTQSRNATHSVPT